MVYEKRLAIEQEAEDYKRIAERVTELRHKDRKARKERRRNIYAWSVLVVSLAYAFGYALMALAEFMSWAAGR